MVICPSDGIYSHLTYIEEKEECKVRPAISAKKWSSEEITVEKAMVGRARFVSYRVLASVK